MSLNINEANRILNFTVERRAFFHVYWLSPLLFHSGWKIKLHFLAYLKPLPSARNAIYYFFLLAQQISINGHGHGNVLQFISNLHTLITTNKFEKP